MGFFTNLFGKKSEPEDPAEFASILEAGQEALRLITSAHQAAWKLGEEEDWEFSQDDGVLKLQFPTTTATIQAEILGSFDRAKGTWVWTWANPHVDESLTKVSRQLRAYGEQHGISRLIQPSWPAVEQSGWDMAGLACKLCGSQGAYRGPAGDSLCFSSSAR